MLIKKSRLVYGILDKLKLQKRFCTLFSKLNQFTAWWIISSCDCTSWHVLSEMFTRTGTQKIVYWFEQVMTTIKNLLPKVYVGETKLYDKYEIMRICIIIYIFNHLGISCYNQMRVWNTPGNKRQSFDNILCVPWG